MAPNRRNYPDPPPLHEFGAFRTHDSHGYVLNQRGDATEKREIFVQFTGLKRATASAPWPRMERGRP